jgi:RHS repeat-associated protein
MACLALLGLAGLLAWAARRGALILVTQRPCQAGLSTVLVVALVLLPLPPLARAGGGGGDSTLYWELADRQGTGMVMLDESGARLVHRTYTPFGMQHAVAGPAGWLPSHYAGHLEDEDSGLVYMEARWYDAEAGVFLSIDPVVADAGDPQAFNAYAYGRNNPVSFTDPTGMCTPFMMGMVGFPAISTTFWTMTTPAAYAEGMLQVSPVSTLTWTTVSFFGGPTGGGFTLAGLGGGAAGGAAASSQPSVPSQERDTFGNVFTLDGNMDDMVVEVALRLAGEAAVNELLMRREQELGRPLTPEERTAFLEETDQDLLGRVRTLADQYDQADREFAVLDRQAEQSFLKYKQFMQLPRRFKLRGIKEGAIREARGLQAIRLAIRRRLSTVKKPSGP